MKILAFAASGSKKSINQALVQYLGSLVNNHEITIEDISTLSIPLYTEDIEKEIGIPEVVSNFHEKIQGVDAVIISFAEHNGSYTAFFKNLFDWLSRKQSNFLKDKQVYLFATSSGARGGQSVLSAASERFPRHGAEVKCSISIPFFNENFDLESKRITSEEAEAKIRKGLEQLIIK